LLVEMRQEARGNSKGIWGDLANLRIGG